MNCLDVDRRVAYRRWTDEVDLRVTGVITEVRMQWLTTTYHVLWDDGKRVWYEGLRLYPLCKQCGWPWNAHVSPAHKCLFGAGSWE